MNLLAHLSENGAFEAVACVRSERAAASLPDLPGVTPRVISYDDSEGLAAAFAGVESVVHLAGILVETASSTYASANVGTTRAVVGASQAAGAEHIVFVSVLGASADSSNAYLRSKGEAERLVEGSGLAATILRTPYLLGPGTAGAEGLLRTAARPKTRLLGGGRHVLRPLDLDDLSRAMVNACRARHPGVSTYDLAGPEPVSFRELVERVAAALGTDVAIGTMPVWLAKLGAALTFRLRGGGVSPTVIDVITSSEVVHQNADSDLGVSLTPLAQTIQKILPEATEAA